MRTITITTEVAIDATTRMVVATEVMIGDDAEAAEAGRAARAALDAFVDGYTQA